MKYLAFLDILGFKELVENNELEELEKLYEKLEGSVLYSMAHTNPDHRLSNKEGLPGIEETNLNSMIISDSIILWTDDDGQGSFLELILAVKYFMFHSIQSGFPLRGAISCGELLMKNGLRERSPKFNSYTTMLGPALTKSYILEGKSNWAGCIIDTECISHFNEKYSEYEDQNVADIELFESINLLKKFKTPMKSGEIEEYQTINWSEFGGIQLTEDAVRNSFSEHNKSVDDWAVESKIQNTLAYLREVVSN